MRSWDIETAEGRGVEAGLRETPGWQNAEGQDLLDRWQEAARDRLEAAKDLPPERWCEVWGVDDEDDEQEGDERSR